MTAPRPDTPADRLARWVERDGEIGLAAERDELRVLLAERDCEIADLRARVDHLVNAAAQAQVPRPPVPTSGFMRRAGRAVRVLRPQR